MLVYGTPIVWLYSSQNDLECEIKLFCCATLINLWKSLKINLWQAVHIGVSSDSQSFYLWHIFNFLPNTKTIYITNKCIFGNRNRICANNCKYMENLYFWEINFVIGTLYVIMFFILFGEFYLLSRITRWSS